MNMINKNTNMENNKKWMSMYRLKSFRNFLSERENYTLFLTMNNMEDYLKVKDIINNSDFYISDENEVFLSLGFSVVDSYDADSLEKYLDELLSQEDVSYRFELQ